MAAADGDTPDGADTAELAALPLIQTAAARLPDPAPGAGGLSYRTVRSLQNRIDRVDPSLNGKLVPAFESVLAKPGTIDDFNRTFAFGRLGWAMVAAGKFAAALSPLEVAAQRIPTIPGRDDNDSAISKFK